MKNLLLVTSCTGALAIALAPGAAYAQDTGSQDEPATLPVAADQQTASEDNVITVTGSRIRRSNATAAIPVQIFNQETIEETGDRKSVV